MNHLKNIIERIEALERTVFHRSTVSSREANGKDDEYIGPQGGIRRLIIEGEFFTSYRDLADVRRELEEGGYIYPRQSNNNALGRLSRAGGPLVCVKRAGKKTYLRR